MSRTKKSIPMRRASPDHPVVSDLLNPIAAFLNRSGMSKSQLLSEWRSALQRTPKATRGIKVAKIGFEHLGSTTISRWLRDPKYLNHAGHPDDLPLRGVRSITSLLRDGGVADPPKDVVALLVELGTVSKISPTRYRLIRRSMNYTITNYLPFEPNFRFLVDATRACTWGSGLPPRAPRLFWLNAYSTRVSQRHKQEFLRFAKERGLSFMHEINDWLEAHESPRSGKSKLSAKTTTMRRLGLGMYGICSNVD